MKSFKFRYSKTVWLLLVLVIILSVVGFVWNIFNIVHARGSTFNLISYYIIAAITAFITVLVVSVMAYGRYVIKGGYLYTYFGFIKSKTTLTDIIAVTHFKKSNKLVVYFKTEEYTVIVISPEEYDDFILALRGANPSIKYDAQIDGEETP